MNTDAIVFEAPGRLGLRTLALTPPGDEDVVVDIRWSGISTGTEKLLWTGRMPAFPGMGYPLVPGYESVGVVRSAGPSSGRHAGEHVFVPGARCFGDVRGLFGGAASTVVVGGSRVLPVGPALESDGVLLALAATAHHAVADRSPDVVVGHGVLGRLVARIAIALGRDAPTVWEVDARRATGGCGYAVVHPDDDARRDRRSIVDASGDASLLDALIARLAKGGEVVLAGFYAERLGFAFAPAFMREARIAVAAEWQSDDLRAVERLVASGRLSLAGLVTHRMPAASASIAYPVAFDDRDCLKMVLDWSNAP